MRIRTRMTSAALVTALIVAPGGVAFAGHHEQGGQQSKLEKAEDAVAAEAKTLEENVENSNEIMKDTYDAKRLEGESRLEAAGDAYTEVVEAGQKKAEEDSDSD